MTKTNRGSDQFQLRLPAGMRDRISKAADAHGRSMNSEIVATLEAAYPDPLTDQDAFALLRYILEGESPAELEARKAEVDAKLEAMGSRARVYDHPTLPLGKVSIARNPRQKPQP